MIKTGCRKDFVRNRLKIKDAKSCVFYNGNSELNDYASIHKTNKKSDWLLVIPYFVNQIDECVTFDVNILDNNKSAIDFIIEL